MEPIVVKLRADPEHRDQAENATSDLRDALSEVAVSVTYGAAPAPAGAKSPEAALVGTLLVTLLGQTAELERFVQAILGWLRQAPKGVSLEVDGMEITVQNASQEDVSRLIDFFVDRPRTR